MLFPHSLWGGRWEGGGEGLFTLVLQGPVAALPLMHGSCCMKADPLGPHSPKADVLPSWSAFAHIQRFVGYCPQSMPCQSLAIKPR